MKLTIGLWNANGLQATAIDDVLQHSHSFDILFITETWLLSPSRLPTTWQQLHNYGSPVAGNFRGSLGMTTLISPSCTLPISPLPTSNQYMMTFRIGTLQLVCCYFPPSLPDDRFLTMMNSIPLTPDTIICGDFNARMGARLGDTTTTTRGRILESWIDDRQIHLWNATLAHGCATYTTFRGGRTNQSIIDLFMSNFSPENPTLSIRSDLSLGSDHHLLCAQVDAPDPITPTTLPPPRRMWNLSRLLEEEPRDYHVTLFTTSSQTLRDRLQALVDHPPETKPPIDALAAELNELIYAALSESVGDRQPRPKHWKWFWTPALEAAAKLRDRFYRRWKEAIGLAKIQWWERHQEAHLAFRRDIKQARRQAYRAFCEALARDLVRRPLKSKRSVDVASPNIAFAIPKAHSLLPLSWLITSRRSVTVANYLHARLNQHPSHLSHSTWRNVLSMSQLSKQPFVVCPTVKHQVLTTCEPKCLNQLPPLLHAC